MLVKTIFDLLHEVGGGIVLFTAAAPYGAISLIWSHVRKGALLMRNLS